ncbi:MAG: hypothetical protein GY853_07895 [PVC group bacterium]|nr:hypothetical protein [PVC group bacterium]
MKIYKIFIIIIALFFIFMQQVNAGEVKEISLTDGSVIVGEVISVNNGVYTIRSGSVGDFEINESRIKSVRQPSRGAKKNVSYSNDSSTNASVNASMMKAGANTLKQSMMSNAKVMELIVSLQNDQQFQEIMKDPEIMNAVNALDMKTLMANPKFMGLLDNSVVDQIGDELNVQ